VDGAVDEVADVARHDAEECAKNDAAVVVGEAVAPLGWAEAECVGEQLQVQESLIVGCPDVGFWEAKAEGAEGRPVVGLVARVQEETGKLIHGGKGKYTPGDPKALQEDSANIMLNHGAPHKSQAFNFREPLESSVEKALGLEGPLGDVHGRGEVGEYGWGGKEPELLGMLGKVATRGVDGGLGGEEGGRERVAGVFGVK
jgi:hypothetical protein